MSKKIFLIHNHKNFSGAARSLGETILNLKKKIRFIVICPKGSSSKYFKSLNIEVMEVLLVPRFNHFELGYYRGFRWLLLIREIFGLIYFFFFLLKLKLRLKDIEKFHLNEIELVIIAPLLKLFFSSRITSHLRCPFEIKKGRLRIMFFKFLCKTFLNEIIAIDNDCYKTSPIKKITHIVYNGINKKNLLTKKIKSKVITFGFVGNFIRRKGIYQVLEVFRKIDKKINTKVICVGKTNQKNFLLNLFRYEQNFGKYIKKYNINKCKKIEILPMTFNLKNFYSRIDIILFPGFMNGVGRPVIEASLLKKPSIIALDKYNNDTARKNSCLIFKPGDLLSFEKKILYLLKNKQLIKKMGISAFKNAKKNFDINKNSKKIYKIIWG